MNDNALNSEAAIVFLAVLAGIMLGAFFFGGLWWTVQKGVASKQPATLFLGSFLLRTLTTVAGFGFIAQGSLETLLDGMAGFLLARVVVTWLTRAPTQTVTANLPASAPEIVAIAPNAGEVHVDETGAAPRAAIDAGATRPDGQ
jgi:F1F0 ATPase subunit 2